MSDMPARMKETILGLDIGKYRVKAVTLDSSGKLPVLARTLHIQPSAEGILDGDEAELQKFLVSWLKEQKLDKLPACLGIPQELATSQICDFPQKVSKQDLGKLVQRVISQIAGLSDESFVSDSCKMRDESHSSVLIGVCRESLVNELAQRLTDNALPLSSMTMNGVALADAFFFLHPEAKDDQRLQMLLDLGTDTSTMLLMRGQKVLFISSLMFGADKFAQILSHQQGCSIEEARDRLGVFQPDWDDPDSFIHLAANQLDTELASSLEQWQENTANSGEEDAVDEQRIEAIWLSGGGARLSGLDRYLAATRNCDVHLLGPMVDNAVAPEFTAALGLACHGSEKSPLPITLLPSLLKWQHDKVKLFPYLLSAYVIVLAGLVAFFTWFHFYLEATTWKTEEEAKQLNQCALIVPKLDSALDSMLQYQKTLVPIVEAGNRSRTFLRTLNELQLAKSDDPARVNDWWCFYLSDELTYLANEREKKAKDGKDSTPKPPPPQTMNGLFAQPATTAVPERPADAPTPVLEMDLLKAMIVCGFTPSVKDQGRYETIKTIYEKLNKNGFFEGTDWFNEWSGNSSAKRWTDYLQGYSGHYGQFNTFALRMPLKTLPITKPAPPPVPIKRKPKK